jgi:hypothetical protein
MASQQSFKSSTPLSTRRLPLHNISDNNGSTSTVSTAKQKIDMKMIRHSQKEAFEELLVPKSGNIGICHSQKEAFEELLVQKSGNIGKLTRGVLRSTVRKDNDCGYKGVTEDNVHIRLKKHGKKCIPIVESPPPFICITAITELSPLTQWEAIIEEDSDIEVEQENNPVVDGNVVDEIDVSLFDEINTTFTSIIEELLENELDNESTNAESLNKGEKRNNKSRSIEYKIQKKWDYQGLWAI